MTSCAATTTTMEALDYYFVPGEHHDRPYLAGVAALALLEQLVEAAQAYVRGSLASGAGLGPAEMLRRYDALAAAVAAVGPGYTSQPPKPLGEQAFQADVDVIRGVLDAADDPNRRRALQALSRLADNMAAVIRAEASRAAVGPGEEAAQ